MAAVFAIADLHLSGNPPQKPMSIFGENWSDHWGKIRSSWLMAVQEEDLVLLPGDISWAMNFSEALEDLQAIDGLPGRKILLRGNHDYWWQTSAKMSKNLPASIEFVHNSFVTFADIAICGSRGWLNPADGEFSENDRKIYEREKGRIALSLSAARKAGYSRFILATHYPMYYQEENGNSFWSVLVAEGIEHYVFGHLHSTAAQWAPSGRIQGIMHHLVACDALDFTVKKILDV